MIILILSVIVMIFWILAAYASHHYSNRIPNLDLVSEKDFLLNWPSVTIVVAARNEEKFIEESLQSLLNLDYPNKNIIVVNDRSTDKTKEILTRMAQSQPSLQVQNIESLPADWIGKNHALHFASVKSTTDWILFTDADVKFKSDALRKALTMAEKSSLDHLTCYPKLVGGSLLLTSLHTLFGFALSLATSQPKVSDPKSKAHIGIGAFNLIRSQVYKNIEGHSLIRLRPDDDLKLGKLVKRAGYRQCFAKCGELFELEWYESVAETIRGLEKNTYAGAEYSVLRVITRLIIFFLFCYLPFVGLFSPDTKVRIISAISVLFSLGTMAYQGQMIKRAPFSAAVGFPLAVFLLGWIIARAAFLAHWRRGIIWREHFYSLQDLRTNSVPDTAPSSTFWP